MAPRWKTICCPVDLSEPAHAALEVAVDLSRRLGSGLVLLHVDAAAKLTDEIGSHGSVEARLATLKDDAARLGASPVTLESARGQPEVAIVEFARERGVDLIVIGTHGRTDREKMLTGSVAEGVTRNAPCPVLTVHAPP